MSEKLKAAVVGVGYLGALHAAKYAAHPAVELVAVFDTDLPRAREVAAGLGCESAPTLDRLLAGSDLVSVAVPTVEHLKVGLAAASAGVHMLVEKPLAKGTGEGRRLAQAADRAGVVLQVGHLERFNPVFDDMRQTVTTPRFIECHRLSPFAGRGGDTNVVYDLMIHDLDLISFLVGEKVSSLEAVGVAVVSGEVDIANARLRFEGGCTANVTASRVSLKRERKLRIFQEDAYVSVDFDGRQVRVVRRKPGSRAAERPMDGISVEETALESGDPLAVEIADFIDCVALSRRPTVGAREGMEALELAERVMESMEIPSLEA